MHQAKRTTRNGPNNPEGAAERSVTTAGPRQYVTEQAPCIGSGTEQRAPVPYSPLTAFRTAAMHDAGRSQWMACRPSLRARIT